MRTVPQRELRNKIAQLLRDVQAGERVRVTVAGRPVADLVPIGEPRRTFVPGEEVQRLLQSAPLDPPFARDLASATGATTDEL